MCKILAKTKDMTREEWLTLRKQGIGGSDAGAVCGLNPYVSPMDVYMDKMTEVIPEQNRDNEAMRLGRDLEQYVAERFCEETGLKVRRSNNMYVHPEYPFMLADVDRLIVGKENGLIGLECKTASPYSADKWKDGKVPAHYLAQCYHYMAVLNAKAWYIAVVIYGREFKFVRIERDEEVIRNLIRLEQDFWQDHVKAGVMPDPDGSVAANDFINSYFKDKIKVAFGIGTYISNDTCDEPLNIVMKTTACNGMDVAKISDDKGKGMCKNPDYVHYLNRCIKWRMENDK